MKKSLLRFMLLVTGLLLGVNVALADYEKVTSTADITDGEYLIVYEADNVAFNGALETLDAVSNTIAVEIVDGKIVSNEAADAAAFTVDVANGTLKSASGKYIGVSSNSNGLKLADEATAFKNSFSIDTDGNAVIAAVFEGSTMTLRFNSASNQLRFRYYKSGQHPIALYKKIDGSEASSAPILTLTAPVGNEVSLTFGVYDTEDEYSVDFGGGTLQTAKVGVNNAGPVDPETGQTTGATVFKGTVAGDGTIKVYGSNDVWYLNASGAIPTSLDQSKLMNVVQMVIAGVDAESVTLPAYEKIDQFSFNNSPVKTVDVSKATSLKSLSIVYSSLYEGEMNLESIDLQNNTELTDLSIQSQKTGVNGKLKEIDLSKNTKLASIYLPNNSLTNVTLPSEFTKKDANDESVLAKVTMFLNGNKLTAIDGLDKLPAKSQVNISNNLFTLATLPAKPANVSNSKYTYAPQAAYEVAESLTDLDLSSQLSATGILTEPVTTSYSFKTVSGTALVEGTDYEVAEPGKFHFIKEQTEKVYGVMATTAFPKFTGNNEYKTTEFTVVPGEASSAPILTLTAPVGNEVSLTFGVYDTEDEYSVDFGDGTLQTAKVGVNNAGPVDPETGQTTGATVFKGTVAGDGTIKVYGKNDVWYLNASGAMPTALDQSKLMNVVQMVIAGVDAESVTLPAYEKIDQFSFNNSPVKTVDVSKATSLKSLSIVYSSLYEGEMNLESIDLQNNTELTDLSIQSQKTGVNGKLKEIDLSKNTKLASIYLPNNSLTNVTLPSEFTKKDANDESVLAKVTMFLNGNKLASIDGLDKLPAKSQVNISNNLFTLATLPVKPANVSNSKYTYAPQAPYEVAESLTDLDLSSQLSATGILTEPVATSYSFKTVSGTALVEGTDYEVAEPGKFHFIKEQTEKVYGVMATTAFPKFTGNNEYKTTEFTVVPGTPSGISNVTAAKQINGKYYNLQGVEIQKPIKGVYIQNGRKVVVK